MICTCFAGYEIEKGTIVIFNAHFLNMSEELWVHPKHFDPSRFIVYDNNNNGNQKSRLLKPDYFFPFSLGKRTCLGHKLNTYISFIFLANLILRYEVKVPIESRDKLRKDVAFNGSLALPTDNCIKLQLVQRN